MGNRVKGRVKKKSIKAASHSSMGSKRRLSRMGKKQKRDHAGIDATFIGRSACLKRLQVSLKDFRRLCILKGVYPREPRGRAPGNKKGQVYYHVKDVRAIAHEPVLHKFREFRTFMKKVRRAAGRNEKDEAARMDSYAPTYTLHHLVRERYPRFVDALSDLDDALTLIYLFAALPSEKRIKSKVTNKAKALAASWGAYCATTAAVTRTFVSVKGVYFEADVPPGGGGGGGSPVVVRWVVPHAFTQTMPTDVDYRVMLTFFEFYETLLGFVLYKLYGDIGVRYPLVGGSAAGEADESSTGTNDRVGMVSVSGASSSLLAANLRALSAEVRSAGRGKVSGAVTEAVMVEAASRAGGDGSAEADTPERAGGSGASKKKKQQSKKSRALIKSVDVALNKIAGGGGSSDDGGEDSEDGGDDDDGDGVDVGAPLKAALESMTTKEEGTIGGLAAGSGGADVHGNADALAMLDGEATKRRRLFAGLTFFLSREVPRGYLELVCLSFGGRVGWEGGADSPISEKDPSITHHIVDRPRLPSSYDALPKSREYVQPQWALDCANFRFLLPCSRYGVGAELPPHLSPWVDDEEEGYKPAYAEEVERLKSGEVIEADATDGAGEDSDDEDGKDASDEGDLDETDDRKAAAGPDSSDDDSDNGDDSDEEEDENKKAERTKKRKLVEEEESKELAKMMMGKKAARLYGRMQHGLSKKQEKVEELQRRRKELESTKEKKGGSTQKKRRSN